MAVKIRLSRGGSKHRPFHKIVVADSRSPRDGRFIERIGHYNPLLPQGHAERFVVDQERVKHWLSKGALATDRLARLFAGLGLMEAPKRRDQTQQHMPKAKAQERMKAKNAPKEEAAPAAAAPAAATPVAEG